MKDLTMAQALSIWTDLLEAEFGRNGFGGDTAEIYAYRLQPCNPGAEGPLCGEIGKAAVREQGLVASRNLHELLSHFRDERGVDVFVGCSRMDDGRPLGDCVALRAGSAACPTTSCATSFDSRSSRSPN